MCLNRNLIRCGICGHLHNVGSKKFKKCQRKVLKGLRHDQKVLLQRIQTVDISRKRYFGVISGRENI